MTAPDLAALSAAATQGEWRTDCAEHDMPYQDIRLKSGRRNIATIGIDDAPVHDFNYAQNANAALITALVNEYRAGRLVQIDEGMRERATLGIWHKLGQIEESARAGQLTMEEVANLADAAIAAMMGGAK